MLHACAKRCFYRVVINIGQMSVKSPIAARMRASVYGKAQRIPRQPLRIMAGRVVTLAAGSISNVCLSGSTTQVRSARNPIAVIVQYEEVSATPRLKTNAECAALFRPTPATSSEAGDAL